MTYWHGCTEQVPRLHFGCLCFLLAYSKHRNYYVSIHYLVPSSRCYRKSLAKFFNSAVHLWSFMHIFQSLFVDLKICVYQIIQHRFVCLSSGPCHLWPAWAACPFCCWVWCILLWMLRNGGAANLSFILVREFTCLKHRFMSQSNPEKLTVHFFHRDELHICLCWPFSAGLLLSVQLGDAFPGQSLGAAFPEHVGYRTLGLHCLPAVPQKILS